MMRTAVAAPWRWATVVALVALLTSGCGVGAKEEADMDTKPVDEATAQFHEDTAALVDELGIEVESTQMRLRRCEGKKGELSEDVYHVWVGVRGLAPESNVDDLIEKRHGLWNDAGWDITRYRHLDSGGVNLAATDPATGYHYSLDSGFEEDPDAYLVGFFNTPCYRSPDGDVDFGTVDVPEA
ncbi:MAG TPA: hypothetical protein H9902_12435 [Candidatus Stackebrandtia faecavium]|nr:hypothetical protein [Candidatus Stackebrandtia faecavium]